MGYDFHITPNGPQLIEVNTNAGGAFLNSALAQAQRACCAKVQAPIDILLPKNFGEQVADMFIAEWRRQRGSGRPATIAIVDDATQYGKGLADQVEKTMKEGGAQVVVRESATDKTTDFKAILTKIKAINPDYIFWGGMDDTAATLVKQSKELGIASHLAGADGTCTETFLKISGEAGKGTLCSLAGMPLEQMSQGEAFKANYEKTFAGQKIQLYAPFSYDAVMAIVNAMKIANSVDREAIAAAMPKVNFEGITGQIVFDPNGDIKDGAVSVFTITDKINLIEVIR